MSEKEKEICNWIKYAKHYLKDAEIRIEVGKAPKKLIIEDCQQAIEWIVKAYLQSQEVSFDPQHYLRGKINLITKVKSVDTQLAKRLDAVIYLDGVAGGRRYPDKFNEEQFKNYSAESIYSESRSVFNEFLTALPGDHNQTELSDFIPQSPEVFSKPNSMDSYRHILREVRLEAFLPKAFQGEASCLLHFRHTTISDNYLTFSNRDIINSFFRGLSSKPYSGKRGFIIGKPVDGKYIVQLKNSRVFLNERQVNDLCEIADNYGKIYIEHLQQIEAKMGLDGFIFAKNYRNRVYLAEIDPLVWEMILKYGKIHDYINTDTSESMFDARFDCIHVWPYKEGHRRRSDYMFSLYADHSNRRGLVSVLWKPSKPQYWEYPYDKSIDLFWSDFWNCSQVHQWFISDLIPKVVYFFEIQAKKKWWHFKKESYEDFLKHFDISRFSRCLSKSSIVFKDKTKSSLLKVLKELQDFFHTPSFNELSSKDFQICGKALKTCFINEAPEEGEFWSYISGNLGGFKPCIKTQALNQLDRYLLTNEDLIDHFKVDLLLRCYIHLLRFRDNKFNPQSLELSQQALLPLVEFVKRENALYRFTNYSS